MVYFESVLAEVAWAGLPPIQVALQADFLRLELMPAQPGLPRIFAVLILALWLLQEPYPSAVLFGSER
jgi:hypothetical protein